MLNTVRKKIVTAGLIAGTLDITAACIQFYLRTGKGPESVLRFVASGLFGSKAFGGSNIYIWAGLAIHFCIAITFAFVFYFLANKIAAMRANRLVTGILYGIAVWAVMNFAVLPLTQAPPLKQTVSGSLQAAGILIVCIGIPLAFLLTPKKEN